MTGTIAGRARGRASLGWAARAALAITLAGATPGTAAGIAEAHTSAPASKSAIVVKEAFRHHFGKILVTPRAGRALYIKPRGGCTGSCLSVWPPVLMPRGKTVPKGAGCLGTAKFGRRRQVTYHHKRLYLFVDDSGHSVNGNGVGGFKVAKVVHCTSG